MDLKKNKMLTFLKKNLLTTIIVIATVVLAGIAIFTAIRLYQLRQQPVAPNAPASKPGASSTACTVTFNLTQAGHCDSKMPYKNDPANTAGNYNLDASLLIPAGGIVNPGDILVYQLNGNSPNRIGTDTVTWTDVLDPRLDWMDGSPCFTFDAATNTATCTLTGVPHTSAYSRTIRVKVRANANTSTSLVNNGKVKVSEAQVETCSIALNFATSTASPTPTPTPTVPPACGTTCTTSTECPSDMSCTQAGICRKTACTSETDCICATATPTPTPTPTAPPVLSCGSSCTSSTQCPTGMSCTASGVCRNTACSSETSCICATATPTTIAAANPTAAPSLPSAGTSWPTLLGIGAGLGTLLLAVFLAL
jgi:hypothetical protein